MNQPVRMHGGAGVDSFVQEWVAGTNGNLYRSAVNNLRQYPIPRWPGPAATNPGSRMLDIGCGWGRWMVAGGLAGFEPWGIDVVAAGASAANRVTRAHGLQGHAIAGELSQLPFSSESFDLVFSYSVLQHAPKTRAESCLAEAHRVLKPGGLCLIEFPLWPGLTNWRHPFSENEDPECWDVRYYRWQELLSMFSRHFDNVTVKADCILGIGVKFEDLDILPWKYKPIAVVSEGFRRLADAVPPLVRFSDSVYISGRKKA